MNALRHESSGPLSGGARDACSQRMALGHTAVAICCMNLACAGCLSDYVSPTGDVPSQETPDMATPPSSSPTSGATVYFNPDIQRDFDALGCSASACHGSSASPIVAAMPTDESAWTSNFNSLHIDCTTLDCLGGGAASLLLTKPLAGGVAHGGSKPFASTADATYQRWMAWLNAGAPYDAVGSIGPADMGTAAPDMTPAPPGTESLTVTFTTSASPAAGASQYDPKNVVVAWVQLADGSFVKTIGRWAATRRTKLVAWQAKAGTSDVDAISSATRASYGTLTATWDLSARAPLPTPADGVYTIRLELADSNATQVAQNNQGTFTFNRNGTASTKSGLSSGGFSAVSIAYSGR